MSEKKVNEKYFFSDCGDPYYTPVEYKYDESVKCMVPFFGKKLNRYEMIQASKPQCDINYILQRALAGDQSVLNVRSGSFVDISSMPDNLNDLNSLQVDSLKSFDSLSSDIKKLFNNNVDEFISAISDGSYISIVNNYVDSLKKADNFVEKKESD